MNKQVKFIRLSKTGDQKKVTVRVVDRRKDEDKQPKEPKLVRVVVVDWGTTLDEIFAYSRRQRKDEDK